jgi:Protein of unknown function DUF262
MSKAEASVEELVAMIERGELRLPEMQRRYVWRSTRVRDLLDSLYRGYPSGAILLWETDEAVPLQAFAVSQQKSPYQSTRLLLDGQQRLTSLSAVIRGAPVSVRGRQKPIELLFNLEHPDELAVVTEVEEGDDDEDLSHDETDYSRGSSDSLLGEDLATLRQSGAAELTERLRLQMGRLDISAEELEGRNRRSSLFKTMFLAFRAAGARDWRSNLTIALDHSGVQHKLQFHHIFPKAVLSRNGYSARQADDIANLAFIGGKTNRAISDKPPKDYLPPMIAKLGQQIFDSQCIPTDQAVLGIEQYPAFLTGRRKEISERLNAFLGTPP